MKLGDMARFGNLKKPDKIEQAPERPPMIHAAVPTGGRMPHQFVQSLLNLVGTGLVQGAAVVPQLPVQQARTRLVQLSRDKAESLLFLDDDIIFTPQDAARLIQADKDVVAGFIMSRSPNPWPCVFNWDKAKQQFGVRAAINWNRLNQVDGVSMAFMLVKMSVFDRIGEQFKFGEKWGEDLDFCLRCREAGISIWLEPRASIGHLTEFVIQGGQQQSPIEAAGGGDAKLKRP